MYDYTGANALYERAQDRFKPDDVKKTNPIIDSDFENLWLKVGANFEYFNLSGALEGLDSIPESQSKQAHVMLLFYHIPYFLMTAHNQMPKSSLDLVLNSKFVKSQKITIRIEDMGFESDKDGFIFKSPSFQTEF